MSQGVSSQTTNQHTTSPQPAARDRQFTQALKTEQAASPAPQPSVTQVPANSASQNPQPSALATITHHNAQLSDMRLNMAEVEDLRASSSLGSQAFSNTLSHLNGERQAWKSATSALETYEGKLNAYASNAPGAPTPEDLRIASDKAKDALSAYAGRSIASDQATSHIIHATADRMVGLSQTGMGAVETVGGVALLLTPEPTGVTKVAGSVGVVHGADTVLTGLNRMIAGGEKLTGTERAAKWTATQLGADAPIAASVGKGVDIVASLGVPAGLIDDIGKNIAAGMDVIPAVANSAGKAIKTGVEAISDIRHLLTTPDKAIARAAQNGHPTLGQSASTAVANNGVSESLGDIAHDAGHNFTGFNVSYGGENAQSIFQRGVEARVNGHPFDRKIIKDIDTDTELGRTISSEMAVFARARNPVLAQVDDTAAIDSLLDDIDALSLDYARRQALHWGETRSFIDNQFLLIPKEPVTSGPLQSFNPARDSVLPALDAFPPLTDSQRVIADFRLASQRQFRARPISAENFDE